MNNKTVVSVFRIPLLFYNIHLTYNKSNNQYIAVKCKRQYQYIRAAADTNRRFELCVFDNEDISYRLYQKHS